MTPNAFIGKLQKPTDCELAAALGPVGTIWNRLIAELADEHGVTVQEWKSYSPKAGWTLRLKRNKRTIVYLIPCSNCIGVLFILGDKALQAARASDLPRHVLKIMDEAKRYPEGAQVQLELQSGTEIAIVKTLATIKLAH